MAVLGFGSVRSCGVTTTVAALAATWPEGRRNIVLELDPSGGTLAAACGLRAEPGLVSLATASRRRVEPDALWTHSQQLPSDTAAVVGPPSATQAQRALDLLGGLFAQLGHVDADVLADCGRLDPNSPARVVFHHAAVRVLLTRPQLPDLHHLASWLEAEPPDTARPTVVVVGPGPYPPEEIRDVLGIEVAIALPHDPVGVARLAEDTSGRAISRTSLLRASRSLAEVLVERLAAHDSPPSEPDVEEPLEEHAESAQTLREEVRSS